MAKERTPNLRKLARRQRWMLWLVLAALLSYGLLFLPWGEYGLVVASLATLLQLVIAVLMILGVILLLTAQGNHIVVVILCGFLMLAPCGNLVVLLFVNMSVTRTLRRAGLHVGLMGVVPDELERILNPGLCNGCGYNLTGNVSGYCPECGRPILDTVSAT
jgi:hypothetical protein